MNLTSFIFFKNTPLTDFQNTIFFTSNNERDNFFINGNHYTSLKYTAKQFNYIRDRQSLNINIPYEQVQGINYCTFLSDFEPNTRYYAYVISYKYINDNVTEINFLIDGVMTFLQGNKLKELNNLSVTRKHLSKSEYNNRIEELQNNSDVIKSYTKRYTDEYKYTFTDFSMLIQSSADFTANFGNVDDPKVESSEGQTFDNISSPLNLYVVTALQFNKFMKAISPYPWIAQNIRSVTMIPSILVDDMKQKVTMKTTDFKELYKLQDAGTTYIGDEALKSDLLGISKTYNELLNMFDLNDNEKHLLRSEYTTTEIYSFNGQSLLIDNGKLSYRHGLKFIPLTVSGYHTEFAIYIQGYKARPEINNFKGSYLNDALTFSDFDDIPIMIDNHTLALSKSANQRKLTESKLVSNRLQNIATGDDIKQRFYDSASLLTNFSPINFFGKFVDEHEYYRQQQAENLDLAIDNNTVTAGSNKNSLTIANDDFGIHIKHAQPHFKEWEKIKKYYYLFGFMLNDEHAKVDPFTNEICNYLQFSGDFYIDNVDVSIVEMIKAQFENGIRLWHNNNTSNPMTQNVLNNKMK